MILFFFFLITCFNFFSYAEEIIPPSALFEVPVESSVSPIDSCLHVVLTSPAYEEIKINETYYLSLLITNPNQKTCSSRFIIHYPDNWTCIPHSIISVELAKNESCVKVLAIKVPEKVLAGIYHLNVTDENKEKFIVQLKVLSEKKFTAKWENQKEYYHTDEPIRLSVRGENLGNSPLTVKIEMNADPICHLNYQKEVIEILPHQLVDFPIIVRPAGFFKEKKQFVFFKVIDSQTNETLYHQPLSLEMGYSYKKNNILSLPTQLSFISLYEHKKCLPAFEYEGKGLIDEKRQRFIDFDFLLPVNQSHHFSNYNEQRLFLNLSEPSWSIDLGDTTYRLSPLTQGTRYGRGIGLDLNKENAWSGIHYTQSICDRHNHAKEFCGYIGGQIHPFFDLTANYMQKKSICHPTSHLVSLESEIKLPKMGRIEVEIATNLIDHFKDKEKNAYRIAAYSDYLKNISCSLEKVYAGKAYFGFYQSTDVLSSNLDFSINKWIQGSLSATNLSQEYKDFCYKKQLTLAPRQRQLNANFFFKLNANYSINFNTLLLKAHDAGLDHQYDFYQKWGGISLNLSKSTYTFYANLMLGGQKSYLLNKENTFLKKYYFSLQKQFNEKFASFLFYEAGNTNYYDAKHWRTNIGGSVVYRYSLRSWIEVLGQKVSNKVDPYRYWQWIFNFYHRFKNNHQIDTSFQYNDCCQKHGTDFSCLISYTIPFDLPIGKCFQSSFFIEGFVYDTWSQTPVADALITINENHAYTNQKGHFKIPLKSIENQLVKVEWLPKNLIPQEVFSYSVNLQKLKPAPLIIKVTPDCSIKGHLHLYEQKEASVLNEVSEIQIVEKKGLNEIKIIINREDGQEIYTSLSNEKGDFEFKNLRPGKWHIRVNTDDLPPLTYLDCNDFDIEIKPNDCINIFIKILPETRKIQPIHNE